VDGKGTRAVGAMSQTKGRVVGVFVGMLRTVDNGQPWVTGLFKEAVLGAVRVTRTGLLGDGQADLVHHGGPDKAVLAYASSHYRAWRKEGAIEDLKPGGLGENLAVEGLDEDVVCIGDTWQVGEVLLQITQPRTPCWKLERRWHLEGLVRRVLETARCGWYLRVLREGEVAAGMAMTLVERPHPDWSVARALQARVRRASVPEEAASLASLFELSSSWRRELGGRS